MERLIVAQLKKNNSICRDKPQTKTIICILLLVTEVLKKTIYNQASKLSKLFGNDWLSAIFWQSFWRCHLTQRRQTLAFTKVNEHNSIYFLRPNEFLHSEGESK